MISRNDIYAKKGVYSWAVKVDFTINSMGGFKDLSSVNTSLLWDQDYILRLETQKIHPQLEDAGATGYRLIIEATDTACDAEKLGVKLAYALLSIAIDKHWGMSLSWPDSPLPCRVIDRTASIGATMQGFGSVSSRINVSDFITGLEKYFTHHSNVPYSLLLSMELCASSHFENNNRSKLIMLVSAFEALAIQKDLSCELGSLLDDLKSIVNDFDIEDSSIKDSLLGQIGNLRRESIRRALKRLLNNAGLNEDDCKFVEEAYQARSKIVHEGHRVAELSLINSRLNSLLIKVYEAKLYDV